MKNVFGKLVLIFLLVVLTESISAQWKLIPTLTKADFNSAVQLTDSRAFVVGDNGTLMITNNRGSTWRNINLGIRANLNSIKFIDGDTYYNSFIVGDLGIILRTDSHWDSWELKSVAPHYFNKDVSFINELNGIVVGYKCLYKESKPLSYYATILVTQDGGLTWSDKSPKLSGKFNAVSFFDENNAIAVGDAGLVAYSDDGGENWYMHRITARNLNAIRVCKSGVKIIVGNEGALYVAKDRHNRWENYSIGRFYDITSICQKSDNTFVITCIKKSTLTDNIINRSVILESRELNGIWKEVFSSSAGPFNSVNFCNSNSAIAVGQKGTIAVYKQELIQDDTVITVDSPTKIEIQNYPNPFNPSTIISFKLPEQSNVELKVYDVLGNEVATLVNEFKPAGNYEAEWNASNLPSGVYIYQLRAGTYTQMKKMLLLK